MKNLLFIATALFAGCAVDPEVAEDEYAVAGDGNIVTTWAAIAADAIVRPVEEQPTLRPPGFSSMLMAQVQLAVYDTMVALREEPYEPFSYNAHCFGDPNRNAAVATTAYRILRTRVPGRAAYLDAQYAATMDAIRDGRRKTQGIALGEEVAAHYLALRANDNLGNTYTWVQPPTGPGVWEPTAPAPPAEYNITFVPPYTFDIAETSNFYPPPPPALVTYEYAHDWTEVRDLGRSNSTIRTEAERQLALWSAENPFRWAARNVNELAVANDLNAMRSARLFAMVHTAGADGLQVCMSAKYHYNLWRPFHSIPRADTDGNDLTPADPTWTPLLNVNHPEYPAGHGCFGAGTMVESVRAFFRTDNVNWTVTTVGVTGLTETSRSYSSLDALSADVGDARVLAGLHYRFSVDAGANLGDDVVDHIMANHFHRN